MNKVIGKECWYVTPANEIVKMRVTSHTFGRYSLQYDSLDGANWAVSVNPEDALFTPEEVRREIAHRVVALAEMLADFDRSLAQESVTYAQAA